MARTKQIGDGNILADATRLGRVHGCYAVAWYFDGNTSAACYAAILRGLEDGDPAVLDGLPSAPLSGEWADGPTPQWLIHELGLTDEGDGFVDDVCTAFEDGFYAAVQCEIERVCRLHLGEGEQA